MASSSTGSFMKIKFHLNCLFLILILPLFFLSASENIQDFHTGRILFLIQQGEHEQALKLYQANFETKQQHDYELLHQIGLRILDAGFKQRDPESQLLALFGAAISAHEDAYYILEGSLKSSFPEIQLVALNALGHFQNDSADQALLRALGSSSIQVRYEALNQLCKKKHPQAVAQVESLMYKTPSELLFIYPSLLAMIGDPYSTKVLKKLFTHPSPNVRLATILSTIKFERDDLLPQLRQQTTYLQCAQQEASAYALGILKDDLSTLKLKKLTLSPHVTVALAAHVSLYHLGHTEAAEAIEQMAKQGNLFAIAALGTISDHSAVLIELMQNSSLQIRLNALIALMEQKHPHALENIREIIIRDKRDLSFVASRSAGHCFKSWKIEHSASQLLKNDSEAYQQHLELKTNLLEQVGQLSSPHFISIAHEIFSKQQNDLIPKTIELLEDLGTKEAIECLKQHQQQLGAPLVRQYCNLALYQLQEPGPYAALLQQFVKDQNEIQFIRFQSFDPWEWNKAPYQLTPEESSKLLIAAFETFTIHQNKEGIETLIESLASGHKKNKYALAGLLLRATQ